MPDSPEFSQRLLLAKRNSTPLDCMLDGPIGRRCLRLCQNSIAPAFMACTVTGTAPHPEMKTIACSRLRAESQLHRDHRATRVDKRRRPAEIGTEQIVCCDTLFGGVVEAVENIEKQLDSIGAAEVERSGQSHVEQRLRR